LVKKFATWMMRYRFIVFGGIVVLTIFFASQIFSLEVKTKLEDLLPQNHPFMKVHNRYEKQLGTPFKLYIVLQVKNGDIYNSATLEKCVEITDAIDAIPGVDHNQVISIASRKIKKYILTADAIIATNFMDIVPKTKSELENFKEATRTNPSVFGAWVSPNEKAVLFSATFIPRLTNVMVLFDKVRELEKHYSDANHEVYACGEPLLNGWIFYFQQKEILRILAWTVGTLLCLLLFYFRNRVGVFVPLVSTLVSAIWGLGFCGLVGINLDPLVMVLPLLISARALSHSVQITERYFECYNEHKEVIPACIECATSILPPGLLGITTDAIGILLIAVAPVPIMQHMAYLCSFWALSIAITVLVLTPILISFFSAPKNIPEIVSTEKGLTQKLLGGIAKLGYGKPGVICFGIMVVLFGFCGWVSTKVNIGDIHPGSPILWPNSNYNVSTDEINKNFPGTEELYVIFEGTGDRAVETYEFLSILNLFQRHMEKDPKVGWTFSARNFLPPINKNVWGGYLKENIVPADNRKVGNIFYLLRNSSAPADFDLYLSRNDQNANVIVWFKDHMGDTIRQGIEEAKKFIEKEKGELAKAKVKVQLASGNIGLLAAINETVQSAQFLNFLLVITVVFLMCALTYGSWVAPIILMIPLNLANLVTLSIMKWMEIGLNINTLPIVSIGVGVGIDYGIYLLTRICEESQLYGEYSLLAITKAIKTTGKAIFFTATTMIAGVIFWYFFSSLRFQAEMGLLLCLIMTINMLGALLCIPCIVYIFKPRFVTSSMLLIKERS